MDARGTDVIALSRSRSLVLLRSVQVGRVAFETTDGVALIPVNFTMDGDDVIVRTTAESRLGVRVGARVAFEADDLKPLLRSGWSVVVRGPALAVTDRELGALRRAVRPWAQGERDCFLRVRSEELTGRQILARPATPVPVA